MLAQTLKPDIDELIAKKDLDPLRELLAEMAVPDVAELFDALPAEMEGVLFRLLPQTIAADVFAYLPLEHQEGLVKSLSGDPLRDLLDEVRPDDRTKFLSLLPGPVTRRLLDVLSPEELQKTRTLLGYPERTAGRYMTPDYAQIAPDMTAREALGHIRRTGRGAETLNVIYVVDEAGKLLEDLRLGSIVMADPDVVVTDIADAPLVALRDTDPVEDAVATFEKYDRSALPVVDDAGHMLGIITVDDIIDLVQKEATADIQKLGGSEALDEPYLDIGLLRMVKKRGGWLAALFIGEMLTATAMGYFQAEIARAAVVALFVPLIISSGGNSGSQATSIVIRSLALRELGLRDWFRVMRREIVSGLSLGVFLGTIGFVRIMVWYWFGWQQYNGHPVLMGIAVSLSLVGVVTFGSLAGSMLPFLLRKIGLDPATASAPFVATMVDVTGLVIYFSIALVVLHGTLL